jgi:hypothetical protein
LGEEKCRSNQESNLGHKKSRIRILGDNRYTIGPLNDCFVVRLIYLTDGSDGLGAGLESIRFSFLLDAIRQGCFPLTVLVYSGSYLFGSQRCAHPLVSRIVTTLTTAPTRLASFSCQMSPVGCALHPLLLSSMSFIHSRKHGHGNIWAHARCGIRLKLIQMCSSFAQSYNTASVGSSSSYP